ncbi:MAG TPA: beta-galactosidase trimerization domain-containing protein [Candidatus Limnocylindria bacterium]|nr:beta-galactosidase trimerization domain-containing protein [Candidatus Limnocylindria bacterium]
MPLPATHVGRIVIMLISVVGGVVESAADPYETYVRTSEDFRSVKQDKAWAYQAFPSWIYMPWTAHWGIGYTEASGRWSVAHGYNGAFIDRDAIEAEGQKTGRLDWIDRFRLRFYVDHAADKGLLHLWDGNAMQPHVAELHGTGIRPVPLNERTRARLQEHLRQNIAAVKGSPNRAAYALDDEPSWGHFVHPTMWRVTDDATLYPKWLAEVYGPDAPERAQWVSYEDIRPKLAAWSLRDFDASPLMDQWTFNDSLWANYVGSLVEYANGLDPATPCGFVGGQAPSAFGGYDYAKLMRKVQFIEAYNLGSSQAIIRSFNPHNALPAVTSCFHRSADDDIWQTWYYLAHGNRGHIGWVEGWFDGQTPKPWHEQVAPTYREAGQKIGPLLGGAEWRHDGVALYYSHASIQLGWILDAEAHGRTWTNRNDDARLSSAVHVRHAWENMLRDSGLQYTWLNYVDVIQGGVPPEFKVLILPACLCLSDAEARQIGAFCRRGGTVIADYLPGLWDQHGKGRAHGGVLDELFGVKHDPGLRAGDIFGDRLWVEVDQDANYSWKTYDEFLTHENTAVMDGSGFHKAVRALPVNHTHRYGRGTAVLLNLSPQWYNAYRVAGAAPARKRDLFLQPLAAAGVTPWVRLKDTAEREHGYEITYWSKPGPGHPTRTVLFVGLNPEISGTDVGGGNSVGLKTASIPITLQFDHAVVGLRDERSGKECGDGREFRFDWKQNEAVVVSFDAR